jgi:hypothetical protein
MFDDLYNLRISEGAPFQREVPRSVLAIPGIKVLCTPAFVPLPVTLNHFHDFIDCSTSMALEFYCFHIIIH